MKLCFIFNLGPHYRFPIYKRIGETFESDIFLGDKVNKPLKTFDYMDLPGFSGTLKNRYWGNVLWQSGVIRLLFRHYDFYIIGGSPYCLTDWICLLAGKLLHKRIICWSHGWRKEGSFMSNKLKKLFFSNFYKLLIYGEFSMDFMSQRGIDRDKMLCIANSLDSIQQKAIRRTLKKTDVFVSYFGNKNPVIIFSGRIQASKKVEMLIEALSILNSEGVKANIVLVGPIIEGYNLELVISKWNVKNQIWYFGECYDEALLAELFYNSSVCASPGFVGLLAIHSLSFGCPVVTHDNFSMQAPEFEAIKEGVTGSFFKENNVRDLANNLKYWCLKNEDERQIIRENAFAEIDRKWNVDYQISVIQKALA